jgi:hypothetical protein
MSANHSLTFPADTALAPKAMDAAEPWVSEAGPMLPARQVVFASLAFIVAAMVVMLAA